jgi:8-oxo-dGTP diphosphatase
MNEPRVGVAALIWKDGRVLLLQRRNVRGAGTWSTPGGHLEYGESLEECARRETREEVGVEVGPLHFRALTNDVFPAPAKHFITIWMEGEYLSGEPHAAAEDEVGEVGWFSLEAPPQPLFLPIENLLKGACFPLPGG